MEKIKSKIATVAIGHSVNMLITEGFDFVLYPAVLAYFGLIRGGVIMWTLSFIFCYLTILFYNWSKKDWLGIETIKSTLEDEHSNLFIKLISWANRRGKWAIMLVLSVFTDPFICMVYMRRNSHSYHKMDKRDWNIFLLSFVLSNVWWTFVMFTGVTIIKYIFIYSSIHI